MRDSDDEDVHDRDYDVAEGISGAFRFNNARENEDAEEVNLFFVGIICECNIIGISKCFFLPLQVLTFLIVTVTGSYVP